MDLRFAVESESQEPPSSRRSSPGFGTAGVSVVKILNLVLGMAEQTERHGLRNRLSWPLFTS